MATLEFSTREKKTGSKNKLKITVTTSGIDNTFLTASIIPQVKLKVYNVTASSSLKTDWAASIIQTGSFKTVTRK